MSESRRGPLFKAGRDQYISYAEQGDATLTAHAGDTSRVVADVVILAELGALREIFAGLDTPSTALLEAAEKEAKEPKPDRAKVAGYVESAVKLATTINGFAEQSDKLIPRLEHIASWVGQSWDAWRPTLGL